jgi:hypothetical protein
MWAVIPLKKKNVKTTKYLVNIVIYAKESLENNKGPKTQK